MTNDEFVLRSLGCVVSRPEGSPRPIVIQTATVHAQGELPVEVKDVNELVTDEAADVSTPRMNLKEELLESDVATQGDAKLSVSVSDEQSTSMLDTSQNYGMSVLAIHFVYIIVLFD